MSNQSGTTTHKRVNVTFPEATLRLLERVAKKGDRSGLLDRAVRFYVSEVGYANLRKSLRRGAIARASRDLALVEEWFSIE